MIQNPRDLLARRTLAGLATDEADGSTLVDDGDVGKLVAKTSDELRAVLGPLVRLQSGASDLGDGIAGVLLATRSTPIVDEQRRALVLSDAEALDRRWNQFCRQVSHGERTVGRFLADLAIAGRSLLDGPGVRVLTIHAAKGLEFRAVFLVGMNEDSFPDYRNVGSADGIADERRNAYVAITRAERMLQLSRPRSRVMPWGDSKPQRASRFLSEMGVVVRDE